MQKQHFISYNLSSTAVKGEIITMVLYVSRCKDKIFHVLRNTRLESHAVYAPSGISPKKEPI